MSDGFIKQRYAERGQLMSGFAERFIEQGMQKGIQQGIQQGMQQGEARTLLRLLRSRFGALPLEVQQTIEAADADTLMQWFESALNAQTLDEVMHRQE